MPASSSRAEFQWLSFSLQFRKFSKPNGTKKNYWYEIVVKESAFLASPPSTNRVVYLCIAAALPWATFSLYSVYILTKLLVSNLFVPVLMYTHASFHSQSTNNLSLQQPPPPVLLQTFDCIICIVAWSIFIYFTTTHIKNNNPINIYYDLNFDQLFSIEIWSMTR